MHKRRPFFLLSVLLALSLIPSLYYVLGDEDITVIGVVKESRTGNPVPNARVLVLMGPWGSYSRMVYHGRADSNGSFTIRLQAGSDYTICVYYDDPLTPGFDYVPSMKRIQAKPGGELNLTFELYDGASLFLDGEILLVETTKSPKPLFSVINPESGEVVKYDGYALKFGELLEFPNKYLELSPDLIIVPAGVPFLIKVDSKVEVKGQERAAWYQGNKTILLSFFIDKPGHFLLEKGEAIHVDLTKFSVRNGLSAVKERASEVGLIIKEREKEGFYVAVEMQRLTRINSLILEAENLFDQGAYESSFARLREAYTEIMNLKDWLNRMYVEALKSVFLLAPFLAFTAISASSLYFEEEKLKICAAIAFYAFFLLATYYLYPGSRMLDSSLFINASLISFIIISGLFVLLPKFLKGREFRGRVPLRNIIVPIFSIAKRNLRRRKLRSALTLISVVILVSSFISLTSFTTGYGLILSKVSEHPGPSLGIMVRTLKSPVMEARAPVSGGKGVFWFTPLENSSIEWLKARPYVRLVAPKYENTPHRQYEYRGSYNPLGYVEGHPIFGIIGIVPSAEAEILSLNETIVEGRYLRDEDENSVLISEKLKEKLNLTVGENLTLQISGKRLTLEVVGVFDDRGFENLRDLDGGSPLPMKIVEVRRTPVEEGFDIITEGLTPCSTSETLVTPWKTASKIPEMHLSRIDVLLEEGEDLKEHARIIALNKGFRVWASTEEGVYLARLASYFEGKGLPVAIPWLIVVLNVVITMLNSLYERRREILIYSSIGINPSQIASVFLAEAGVIGIIGGGIGYLLGFGWYRAFSLMAASIQVRQKISALWTLAAMAVSLAAVLVGGLTALKGSVIITPSLKRRWKIDTRAYKIAEPFKLTLPIWIAEEELEEFMEFVLEALRSKMDDYEEHTYVIREGREEREDASIRTIEFFYASGGQMSPIHTRNKFILRKERKKNVYEVILVSDGLPEAAQKTGSFVRRILLEWNVKRGKLGGSR